MRVWTSATICSLMVALAVSASAQATDIAADARWYVKVDVQQLLDSDLAATAAEKHDISPDSPAAARFERFAGFNPVRDVDTVLMYHHSFQEGEAVVVLRGQFDPDRIGQRVAEAPRHERIDVAGLAGHRFEMPTERGPRVVDAVVRGGWIALSADGPALTQAVQVLTGERRGLGADAELLAPAWEGMWFEAGAIDLHQARTRHSEMLRAARNLNVAAGEFNGELRWQAQVTVVDADRAQLLADAAEGLLAMARLRHEPDSPIGQAIASLDVAHEDERVRLWWSQPVDAALELMQRLHRQRRDR